MECYGKQIWTNLTKDTLHELGIDPPDEAKYKAVKARWDAIAKPLDGMGRFEEIAAQIGAVTNDNLKFMNNAFLIEENNCLKKELEKLKNSNVEEDEEEI